MLNIKQIKVPLGTLFCDLKDGDIFVTEEQCHTPDPNLYMKVVAFCGFVQPPKGKGFCVLLARGSLYHIDDTTRVIKAKTANLEVEI